MQPRKKLVLMNAILGLAASVQTIFACFIRPDSARKPTKEYANLQYFLSSRFSLSHSSHTQTYYLHKFTVDEILRHELEKE